MYVHHKTNVSDKATKERRQLLARSVQVVLFQHGKKKNTFRLNDVQERQISVSKHQLLQTVTSLLYPQFCTSQKRLCCLSDNFIISAYKVAGLQIHCNRTVGPTAQNIETLKGSQWYWPKV